MLIRHRSSETLKRQHKMGIIKKETNRLKEERSFER